VGLDSQGSLQSNVSCCLVVFRNAFGFEKSLGSHGECSEPWSFHDRTEAHASLGRHRSRGARGDPERLAPLRSSTKMESRFSILATLPGRC